MKDFLTENFLSVWHQILYFEISRSRAAVKSWGNANCYLVFEVTCWHHILALTSKTDLKLRDEAVKLWFSLSRSGFDTSTVLTYTLISDMTSLSIETVRRQVKKLEEKKWASYSKKNGVILNPSDENNKYLADVFNVKEVDNLGNLLETISKKKAKLSS